MRKLFTAVCVSVLASAAAQCGGGASSSDTSADVDASFAEACERLVSFALPNVQITSATAIVSGTFSPPMAPGARPLSDAAVSQYAALPSFCRVTATLTPSDDSDIKAEVWLPEPESWNGKLQAVGNGAFTGSHRYGSGRSLSSGLSLGYATASSDTGHVGGSASFGLGHPEKVIDFGWRSTHEMTVTAKAVIEEYYGNPPDYSYWFGCSAGGRQALKQAQRFPGDYDGIIAGAPGNDWIGRAVGALKVAKVLEGNESAQLLEDDRLLVHEAVLAACDASDGVTDRVVGDPERCDFDPGSLLCEGENTTTCLTAAQVETARMLYSSPKNPKSGREITGLLPGSETNWTDLGWTRSARNTGVEQFKYLIDEDPEWTIDRFDFDRDIVRAEEIDDDTLNALDPDLTPFFSRGGKILAYHGWSDAQISPKNATQYYERMKDAVGDDQLVHDSYRLFMAPGMGHCAGGEGPNSFDALTVMEEWVEGGQVPDSIVASRTRDGVVDRTRPLCPYPQLAVYNGNGSTDDAANFTCQMP